jgi:hypothetical protein
MIINSPGRLSHYWTFFIFHRKGAKPPSFTMAIFEKICSRKFFENPSDLNGQERKD